MSRLRYRFMVQVEAPDDGTLWLLPYTGRVGLARFGSEARRFPDAAEAEVVAAQFRRDNPGWKTRIVEWGVGVVRSSSVGFIYPTDGAADALKAAAP